MYIISVSARIIIEQSHNAWGYIWGCWLHFTGLKKGYWYVWWYCIPLDLIIYQLHPILRNLGLKKYTLFVLECHLLAFPIIRAIYSGLWSQDTRKCIGLPLVALPTIFAIYYELMILGKIKCTILFVLVCLLIAVSEIPGGLRIQARNAMRHVHDTCWRSIQISRAKMQGWRALINQELLTRFGKQETGCVRGIESYTKGILHLMGQGYEIEKDKLIQLWIAAGYMESEPMERHGANYFEKLVSEGYLIPSDSNLVYKVNSNKVNSDLDKMRGKSSYLRLERTSQSDVATADILHVSVVSNGINDKMFNALGKFKRLRTLLFLYSCSSRIEQVPLDLFLSFESLVTLDLSRTNIKELPSSALKMMNLRYLDLSWTLIEVLPEAIRRFQRLQTLKLRGCYHLWRLPREMARLAELRHLDFDVLGQLSVMPKGMGVLVNLRTLSAFIVGSQEGFRIGELRDLNNLMGEFCIAKLEHVQSAHDAEVASLSAKKHLKKLKLRWSDFPLQETKNEHVLQNLCPPSDLEELQIQCYGGFHFPSWIGDESFHKLAGITLFKCEHVLMLPALQKLPSLQYLGLISLNCVKEMDVLRCESDRVAFPKLERLIIDEMLNLNTWLEGEKGDFPCLIELTIKHCPQLSGLPSLVYLTSLKRLEISSYPKAQFTDDKQLSASLESLIIENCPLIKAFCDKIKHVQNVWIDQEVVMDRTVATDDDDDGSELINEECIGIEDDDDCCKGEAKIRSEIKQVQNVRIDEDQILEPTDDDDDDDDDDDGPDQQPVIKESCFKEDTRGDSEWDEIKPAVDFLALEQILNMTDLDDVVERDYRNTDEDETFNDHTSHWLNLTDLDKDYRNTDEDETFYDHTRHWLNFFGLAGEESSLVVSPYNSYNVQPVTRAATLASYLLRTRVI